ncbi:MAG: hypothetical protein OIF35_09020, partial [Cellvibrionaceae bacterium]|nr:hypothetical protein [Cellvibrionaceae bacterium]
IDDEGEVTTDVDVGLDIEGTGGIGGGIGLPFAATAGAQNNQGAALAGAAAGAAAVAAAGQGDQGDNPFSLFTPLVLDLDGDGTETLSVQAGVRFDIDADGSVDSSGWVAADDGLLVRDINGDGQINNGAELFGGATLMADGNRASDGFAALAGLDSNADGVIDSNDGQFDELQVWRDGNSDGQVQDGELLLLAEADVLSINLDAVASAEPSNGNIIGLQSDYERADGSQGAVDDVWFAYQPGDAAVQAADLLDLGTDGELPLPATSAVATAASASAPVDLAQLDSAALAWEPQLELVCQEGLQV